MNESDIIENGKKKADFLFSDLIAEYPETTNGDLMLIGVLFMQLGVEIAHGHNSALLFEKIMDGIMPDIIETVKKYA